MFNVRGNLTRNRIITSTDDTSFSFFVHSSHHQMDALPSDYSLHHGYPPVDAYCTLRIIGNFTPTTEEQASRALAGSWHGVYITHSPPSTLDNQSIPVDKAFNSPAGDIVGMGRIVGDNGWYFIIADIVVHPAHRRRGFGEVILQALLKEIQERAPKNAYVSLVADPPGVGLYKRNGFEDCVEAKGTRGMFLRTS